MITNEHIEQYLAQAHRYGDAKLMLCSNGNLSWRIGEEALVSGTGSWVPNLQKEKYLFAIFLRVYPRME